MQAILISGEFLAQDLDRDLATELHVLGQIDLAHSARAELLQDSVMRNLFGIHLCGFVAKNSETRHSTMFQPRLVERATESRLPRGEKCPTSRGAEFVVAVVRATAQSCQPENASHGSCS